MNKQVPMVTSVVSKNSKHQGLIQGNDYPVIGIHGDYYHVVDDSGEPILYPKVYFIDCDIPPQEGWIFRHYEGGEYTYYPPEFDKNSVLEFFHDDDPDSIRVFREFCHSYGIKLPNL